MGNLYSHELVAAFLLHFSGDLVGVIGNRLFSHRLFNLSSS